MKSIYGYVEKRQDTPLYLATLGQMSPCFHRSAVLGKCEEWFG